MARQIVVEREKSARCRFVAFTHGRKELPKSNRRKNAEWLTTANKGSAAASGRANPACQPGPPAGVTVMAP